MGKYKKVYFIHQNTRPINICGKNAQIPTDFVCTSGYLCPKTNKVYIYPDLTGEIYNFFSGIWWDTFEEGEEHLVTLLKEFLQNDINSHFKKLLVKYPEYVI